MDCGFGFNIETTSCNSRNNIETTTQTTAETTAETATQWLWAVSSGLWVRIFGWLRLSYQKFPHKKGETTAIFLILFFGLLGAVVI